LKKKILILSGGISKERLISLDTGLQVAKELKKNGYRVKICEPNNNLKKNIKTFKPSLIFNALILSITFPIEFTLSHFYCQFERLDSWF